MKILVTGAAGFIGFHTAQKLLARGDEVVGLDNLNDYYDVRLKLARLEILKRMPGFSFVKLDLADRPGMTELFAREKFHRVINLGAQAGVRYSIQNPLAYVDSNVVGFANILEGCRHNGVEHLVYASTSSVYGANTNMPFSVHQNVDHPLSFYAATKKANELMAHTYAHLYSLPVTGLRFFTVYGPWGRPDMALFLFTRNILEGKPIDVFNYGHHRRDFTYVDDIAEGVVRSCDRIASGNHGWDSDAPDPGSSRAPYRQQRLNFHAHQAGGFLNALQRQVVGNAQVLMKQGGGVQFVKALVNLRAYAMNQNQAYAQTAEQGKIMNMVIEIISQHRFATQKNDKGFVAVRMDIGR